MTHCYGAYGLNIQSDIPVDFLVPSEPDVLMDVSVAFRPDAAHLAPLQVQQWEQAYPLPDMPDIGVEISKSSDQLKLLYRRDPDSALEFIVSSDAKHVTLVRPDEIPEIDAISFFIGPVCGVLSRLRAKTCLHASVLTINGRAFALTGEKRAGKSTTSAMLTRCGANLVADDIAVINHRGGQFWVEPAYPFMRLSPPAIELTGRSLAETYELLSIGDKRYVPVQTPGEASFPNKSIPLDAIYLLSERQGPQADMRIDQLEPTEAARVLNTNSYAKYMMDDAMRRQDFSLFAKFAREKHSRAISRPDDLSRLAELAKMIVDDFQTIHD